MAAFECSNIRKNFFSNQQPSIANQNFTIVSRSMDDSINVDVGSLDIEAIENELKSTKDKKRGTYSVYTPQKRFIQWNL